MRSIKNSLFATAGLVLALLTLTPARGFATASPVTDNGAGGITVTPAALTLTLKKGAQSTQRNFTVTNTYHADVALHFSLAQPVPTPGAKSALAEVQVTPQDVVVPAGASVVQTLTLTDNTRLAPGSQQLELIMAQQNIGSANMISVVPSIRLPLITIKEDGAVTSFGASAGDTPAFSLKIPSVVMVVVHNTGNMVSVPRGYVSVTDPRGREVSKGVLNTASQAITPGSALRLRTPMTMVDHPWPPGPYHIQVHYGIGGGQQARLASVRMVYLPVWQMLLAVLIVAIIICIRQIWIESAKLRQAKIAAPAAAASTAEAKPAPSAAPKQGDVTAQKPQGGKA